MGALVRKVRGQIARGRPDLPALILTLQLKLADVEFSRRIGQSWQSKYNAGKNREMTDPTGDILTLEEVEAHLKAGKRTGYRLAQQSAIPAFKLGGTWRFRREELDRWIAASIEKKPEVGGALMSQFLMFNHVIRLTGKRLVSTN